MGDAVLLLLEALFMHILVLGAHSLRHRFGPAPLYALLDGITAIMSWVADPGLAVEFAGTTFVMGLTAFYTSLLLCVYVIYDFDVPRAARIAITSVVTISALMPIIPAALPQQPGTAAKTKKAPALAGAFDFQGTVRV